MPTRSLTFASFAAAILISQPAAAHEDGYHHQSGHHAERYDGSWEGDWTGPETYEGSWEGTYEGAAPAHHMIPEGAQLGRGSLPLAYSPAQRARWLADCRALYAMPQAAYGYEYAADDYNDGKVIGGIAGAVIGGFAGNRIAGGGNRVLGTVIGAGLGGLAGSAIGDSIDDRAEARYYEDAPMGGFEHPAAAGYCEAYLNYYEATGSLGGTTQVVTVMQAAPAPRMRKIVTRSCDAVCGGELQPDYFEEAAPTARREIPRRESLAAPAPAAKPTKLVPTKGRTAPATGGKRTKLKPAK